MNYFAKPLDFEFNVIDNPVDSLINENPVTHAPTLSTFHS